MGESSIAKASLACFVAFVMVIGFTAAPVAAADDGISVDGEDGVSIGVGGDSGVSVGVDEDDGVSVDTPTDDNELPVGTDVPVSSDGGSSETIAETADSDSPSPVTYDDVPFEEIPVDPCRDAGDEIQENVPFADIPWFEDLPEQAQPPNQVPTNLVRPAQVPALVFGAAPSQCDVQDPTDPSVDPTNPAPDPAVSHEVARGGQYRDGAVGLVYYEATLNESGEGPSVSGSVGGMANPHNLDGNVPVTVNDGEKEYSVSPTAHFEEDGTGYATANVFTAPAGGFTGNVKCNGQVCKGGQDGLPGVPAPPEIPAPTSQEDDGGSDDGSSSFCRDIAGEVQDGVPFEQVPWFGDLPEQARPEQIPTNIVTPKAVAAIVFGAVPNQCEVQDPNDPSVDPTDPPTEPGVDHEVARMGEFNDGMVGLVYYEATLNESGEGPGVSGSAGTVSNPNTQDWTMSVSVNDGEKDYSVSPHAHVTDDGTGYGSNEFGTPFGSFGGSVKCDGAECQPGTSGLPEFVAPPAVPAPTSQESDDGGDDGDDSDNTFPSEFCTDVGNQVLENFPFEQVPYFDDLPEEARPEQIPTNIVTPRAVAAIVFGATPNQCEVQDPNDPSVDPTDPPTEPGVDHEVARFGEFNDGVVGLVFYEATLNESGEGPGVSGSAGTVSNPNSQDWTMSVSVNDGEKDYSVSPHAHVEDGTLSGSNEFGTPFGRFGGKVKCDSGGCQPGTTGLPKLVEVPHIPPES